MEIGKHCSCMRAMCVCVRACVRVCVFVRVLASKLNAMSAHLIWAHTSARASCNQSARKRTRCPSRSAGAPIGRSRDSFHTLSLTSPFSRGRTLSEIAALAISLIPTSPFTSWRCRGRTVSQVVAFTITLTLTLTLVLTFTGGCRGRTSTLIPTLRLTGRSRGRTTGGVGS